MPSSRKARALLAFLVATGRPHRRERLCEIFWDVPDDPKAALRWSLSKLRKVVDMPGHSRIIADRERVHFDATGVLIDIDDIHSTLYAREGHLAINTLERMARRLELMVLDGLDGVGDETFASWLTGKREDAHLARVDVLRQLATHPDISPIAAEKWHRLWRDIDPAGASVHDRVLVAPTPTLILAPKPDSGPEFGLGRGPLRRENPQRTQHIGEAGPAASQAARGVGAGQAKSLTACALGAQRIGFCAVQDGTKIAYATIGSGRPLLKAANWLNHLEFDWGSPIWGRTFAEIARRRTFIRYDERGCGLSDWKVADLSFDAFVEDLEAVADKLELKRFPLLGISQGCAVAIEYAVRHPERVSGLMLFGGYAAGWRHSASAEEQARREAVLTLTELGWGTDNPAYRHIFSQTFMPDATAAELTWFDEFQRQTTSPANASRFQEAFGRIDVRHRLADVKAPTIVLHSRYDQRIPLELGRAVASGIPDARFFVLESRNHILVEHEPAWKTCLETMAGFMAEKGI
ncbi:MAG: alpha/beta fold hydrolase [Alphaproteobacteria bacterium]